VKDHDRYHASHLAEGQFHPGSNLAVLRNLMGIKSAKVMDFVETVHLARAQVHLMQECDAHHRFVARDIQHFFSYLAATHLRMGWPVSAGQRQ
jgi:hypothetical protein